MNEEGTGQAIAQGIARLLRVAELAHEFLDSGEMVGVGSEVEVRYSPAKARELRKALSEAGFR